jgi:hypothetical protein
MFARRDRNSMAPFGTLPGVGLTGLLFSRDSSGAAAVPTNATEVIAEGIGARGAWTYLSHLRRAQTPEKDRGWHVRIG